MLLDTVSETSYMTPRGHSKLETELAYLRNVKRLDVIERLHDALAGGDGLDNSEYLLVQEEWALVEGRIQELDYILRYAELIQPSEGDGLIHLGSTVVVQEEGADQETYTLVGPAEADPCQGCISNRSPLGRALLDQSVGDDVEIMSPDGPRRFRIIAVN